MPKRLGLGTIFVHSSEDEIKDVCKMKGLNDYETEIIVRIYHKKQSLDFVADTMDFTRYGKTQSHYSKRSINNFHKEAFLKLMRKD